MLQVSFWDLCLLVLPSFFITTLMVDVLVLKGSFSCPFKNALKNIAQTFSLKYHDTAIESIHSVPWHGNSLHVLVNCGQFLTFLIQILFPYIKATFWGDLKIKEMHSKLPNDNHLPEGDTFPPRTIFIFNIFCTMFFFCVSFQFCPNTQTPLYTCPSLSLKSKCSFLWYWDLKFHIFTLTFDQFV